jgi:hypothetical protein
MLAALATFASLRLASDGHAQQAAPTANGGEGSAAADDSPTERDAAPLASKGASPLPGEVGPAEYLVPDRDGKLQHVLNFSFERFMRLYRLQQRLDPQDEQPHFVIQEIRISGIAKDRQAELTAEFSIDVRDSGWVRVPLRLGQAVLLKEAEYEGPGEQLLDFENQQGYVSWIHSEPGKVHKITLKLLVPLVAIGGETVLKLNLPRAPLSKLELRVTGDPIQGRVSEESELVQGAAVDGQTPLTVLRLGGDFELAWRVPSSSAAEAPVQLEAIGKLLVRIDGRSVNTEARLAVRSFGGPFDRFQLRLPPGANLIGANQIGVQLALLSSDDKRGQLYEVRLKRKTVGPLDLRLVTERRYNAGQADELLELGGFEVQGAVSQWGHIAVVVVGDWQVIWGPQQNVRQIDELPDVLRRENLVAGFEYNLQPFSLAARVVPQKTRINVESSEYQISVGAQQVQLQARWKYNIRGAKLRTLDIELPGWEIDEIGPPGLVNPEVALGTDELVSSIPLAQAAAGQLDVTLRAHQNLAAGESELSFTIPRPHADTVSPAIVAISPADNVELTPRPESIVGLASQSLRSPLKLVERQQDPLFYRTEGKESRFVAGIQLHEQAISADALSTVSVEEQTVSVEQRLVFQVAYEPVDSLTILVPRGLPLDSVGVTLDGQPLSVGSARGDPLSAAEEQAVRISLPGPRIGRLELQLRYTLTHDKLTPAATTSVTVPLAMPGVGKFGHNQLRVLPQAGIVAVVRNGLWTAEANSVAIPSALQFIASQPVGELPLALELKQRPMEGKTVVECGWIQTILVRGERQDRVLYRFHSGERQLRVALPSGAIRESLEVSLDGKPITTVDEARGEYVIPLSTGDGDQHLLDLSYSFPRRSSSNRLLADPPEIRPAPRMRQLYWELIMPSTDHLLLAPAEFTSEYSWVRSGFLWHREPSLDQAELEHLLGATSAATPNSAQVNRYLFSTVRLVPPLELWWAPRSVLVFGASALLLAVGLALIYYPLLRHPATVFTLGVLVFAATQVNPETAIVVAQAGALGVVLVILAGVLAHRTLPPVASTPPVVTSSTRGSSRAVLDRSITEAYFRGPRTTQPSTATAPAVQVSPESQP